MIQNVKMIQAAIPENKAEHSGWVHGQVGPGGWGGVEC